MNELLTAQQMARADAWAVEHGVPAIELMARAGRGVAAAILARFAPCQVLVLCGPGNNGGDGYVVACQLAEAGWPVAVAALVEPEALRGEARHHALQWVRCHAERAGWGVLRPPAVRPLPDRWVAGEARAPQLVVDALFGAGLQRPLAPEVQAVLRGAAQGGIPIVAIDVPSGLHGDTGQDLGATGAALTVTFFRKKPGHVLMPGKALCGELVLADIGIAPDALAPLAIQAWENGPSLWRAAWALPNAIAHKYQRGHVIVFGGSRMVGAARLSGRAAARIGAGLTTLAVPADAWPVHAGMALSAMVHPLADEDQAALANAWAAFLAPARWAALVLGPGAMLGLPGDAIDLMRELVMRALASPGDRPIVLDADALMAFESDAAPLFDAIKASRHPVVVTPHEGEFNRLFGMPTSTPHKLARTREAAARSGAVVLHKGADTVVAAPDGRAVVNTQAPPWLATAGSGDVLAGFIAGLLAQGLPVFEAACAGAWVHGACGRAFGPGLIADDLPEQVPAILKAWMVDEHQGWKAHGPGGQATSRLAR
ncbi:MAG: NAD(P)H-hydrate dehydratase [Rubrivivax sp.]|nr:MAG: NAD(P)H-hydrate dehydratase [Rubrivivax sp.]